MRRKTVCLLLALLISLCLTCAPSAQPADESDLFFTQSEAESVPDIDRGVHPVTWIFIALGVSAVAGVGVLTFVNRREKI